MSLTITRGPEDAAVPEGGSATFHCWYTGTTQVPFWSIGGSIFTLDSLPDNHYYSNRSVTVYNVGAESNGTEYQCQFFTQASSIGVLTVIAGPSTETESDWLEVEVSENDTTEGEAVKTSSEVATQHAATTEGGKAMKTSSEVATQQAAATTLVRLSSLDTTLFHQYTTQANAHHRTTASEAIKKEDKLALIPIAAVIGLVCVVVIALLCIFVVLIIKKARRKVEGTAPEVDIEAEYEVIDLMTALPPLGEQNSCSARASACFVVENSFPGQIYAEVEDGIAMKSNDAYQLTKQDQKILSTLLTPSASNSGLPPRPIADRQKRMLNTSPPLIMETLS